MIFLELKMDDLMKAMATVGMAMRGISLTEEELQMMELPEEEWSEALLQKVYEKQGQKRP
ncbi:MAG: hypothetical protein RL344_1010 [Pseudomonadota bacterium]|jgi:hypothetical protein